MQNPNEHPNENDKPQTEQHPTARPQVPPGAGGPGVDSLEPGTTTPTAPGDRAGKAPEQR